MRVHSAAVGELATVVPDAPASLLDGLRVTVSESTGGCLVATTDEGQVAGYVIFSMMHSSWDAAEFVDVHRVSVPADEVASALLDGLRHVAADRATGAIRLSAAEETLLAGAQPTHLTKQRFTLAAQAAESGRHSMIRRVRADDVTEFERMCRAHAVYEKAAQQEAGFAGRLMAQMLDGSPRVWGWVVPGDNGLIGYMTCSREYAYLDGGDYVHMDTLYLDEGSRGAGIGAKLIAHAAADALERGIAKVRWQTPSWNAPAIRFYERIGAIGVQVDQLMV